MKAPSRLEVATESTLEIVLRVHELCPAKNRLSPMALSAGGRSYAGASGGYKVLCIDSIRVGNSWKDGEAGGSTSSDPDRPREFSHLPAETAAAGNYSEEIFKKYLVTRRSAFLAAGGTAGGKNWCARRRLTSTD